MTPSTGRRAVPALVVLTLLGLTAGALAQAASPTPQREPRAETLLAVDVVLSRSQGANVVSRLPFSLMLTVAERSGGRMSLRMGVDVPIGTTTTTTTRGTTTETATATTKPEYRHVGTAIDAWAEFIPDGRFRVWVSAQDSSFYGDPAQMSRAADAMAFRTFTMSNSLAMRLGETRQFAVATDRVSGEVVTLEVTINAVK